MAKRAATSRITAKPKITRYHLIIFQGHGEMIDRDLVSNVHELLSKKVNTPPEQTAIDIWIDSGGGDAHAAFKLNRLLRSRCCELRAVVPDYAKSAATLLSIGCDHVFAAPSADFGPLDVQIEHPDREGKIVSSLAGANAAENLAMLGVSLMLAMGKTIIDVTDLPRENVIKHLFAYTSDILKPVLSKLDPQLIHEAGEQLKVTRQYAEKFLKSVNKPMSDARIQRAATMLITHYPTHGYVIDLQELRNLGVSCSALTNHPLCDRILSLYERFSSDGRQSILELITV